MTEFLYLTSIYSFPQSCVAPLLQSLARPAYRGSQGRKRSTRPLLRSGRQLGARAGRPAEIGKLAAGQLTFLFPVWDPQTHRRAYDGVSRYFCSNCSKHGFGNDRP